MKRLILGEKINCKNGDAGIGNYPQGMGDLEGIFARLNLQILLI
jgi:hypothetical protein